MYLSVISLEARKCDFFGSLLEADLTIINAMTSFETIDLLIGVSFFILIRDFFLMKLSNAIELIFSL